MDPQNADRDREYGKRKTTFSAKQVTVLLALSATHLLTDMMFSWNVVLPKLEDSKTSKFLVTEDDVAWLGSLTFIMITLLSPLAGILAEHIGPRRLLVTAMFPVAGFWLLKAYGPSLWLLYLGRALLGISATVVYTVLHPLIAELCPARIRGLALVLPEIFGCVGMLLSYLLAYFLSWEAATAVSAAPFVPLSLMLLLVPEVCILGVSGDGNHFENSPYWLVRKKKIDAAEKSLRFLWGRDANVDRELEAIRSTTVPEQSEVKNQIKELRKIHNALPVVMTISLLILRELAGGLPIFTYSVYMIRDAGVQLDAFFCTVFIGVARLASTCVSACISDVVGRRPLLVASTLVCAVSEGVAGTFLTLEAEGPTWVPLASVIVFAIGYGLGLGPISWVYIGELLPTPVRSLGAAMATFGNLLSNFVLSLVFLKMATSLGLGFTLLLFGGANLTIALLVLFLIPETAGRTLQDMEKAFMHNRTQHGQENPALEMDIIPPVADSHCAL
ncbi:facilitated trehalose transporter Tret1 [Penaeus vannamei]|uniref:facilitated trehalose transporter Tret1 n=1 Tax=Penaeus vannamei TaxID=6689 RepID=UPI00387F5D91